MIIYFVVIKTKLFISNQCAAHRNMTHLKDLIKLYFKQLYFLSWALIWFTAQKPNAKDLHLPCLVQSVVFFLPDHPPCYKTFYIQTSVLYSWDVKLELIISQTGSLKGLLCILKQ